MISWTQLSVNSRRVQTLTNIALKLTEVETPTTSPVSSLSYLVSSWTFIMETPTYPSRHLTLSPPFPFASRREEQDKLIFGDRSNFREIKPEFSEKKSGFRFEHLATEFENKMDENDSGIGKV